MRRLVILPQVRVSLGDFSNELLFDLSEGGLAVYGSLAALGRRTFPISFQLPGNYDPISTQGEVAWTGRNRTGIRFVDFSNEARSNIRHWMTTQLPAAPAYGDDYKIDWSSRLFPSRPSIKGARWNSNFAAKIVLVLGVSVLAALLVFELSRFHSKPKGTGGQASANASALQSAASEQPGQAVAAQPSANTEPVITKVPPTAAPAAPISSPTLVQGFVIQVGALRMQSNADSLSNSLRHKGFPVIVTKNADDQLYHIAVGPYPDLSSAVGVRNALKEQGLDGFVKSWVRE